MTPRSHCRSWPARRTGWSDRPQRGKAPFLQRTVRSGVSTRPSASQSSRHESLPSPWPRSPRTPRTGSCRTERYPRKTGRRSLPSCRHAQALPSPYRNGSNRYPRTPGTCTCRYMRDTHLPSCSSPRSFSHHNVRKSRPFVKWRRSAKACLDTLLVQSNVSAWWSRSRVSLSKPLRSGISY